MEVTAFVRALDSRESGTRDLRPLKEERPSGYNNLFGIFVGVEKFPCSEGHIKSLWHANEDADELCELFQVRSRETSARYELCLFVNRGYDPRCTRSCNQSVRVLDATRANILKELTRCLKAAQPGDLLLVYISTHGAVEFDDCFFIPSDGANDNVLGTGIAASTLVGAIGKATSRGVKALMVIDTCHAGAVNFDISKYEGEFSCLLSSSPVEYSYEFYNVEHGVFTNYLLKGLRGEAQKDDAITLIGLFDYVYEHVQKETQKRQNPLLIGTMKYDTVLIGEIGKQGTIGDRVQPITR
jgi:hypothetical protein